MTIQNLNIMQISKNLSETKSCRSDSSSPNRSFFDLMQNKIKIQKNQSKTYKQDIANVKGHQLIVDPKMLDDLKNIFEHAGFDKRQVAKLISELKSYTAKTGLKLSDLFTSLNALKDDMENGAKKRKLELSALPYIEIILSNFSLKPDEINNVLEKSTKKNKGIIISDLIANLKKVQKNKPDIKKISINETSRNQLNKMLQKIGLSEELSFKGFVTLERFIADLEALPNESCNATNNKLINDIDHLLSKIKAKKNVSQYNKNFDSKHQESTNFSSDILKLFKSSENSSKISKVFLQENQNNLTKALKEKNKAIDKNIHLSGNNDEKTTGFAKAFSASGKSQTPRFLPTYVINQVSKQIMLLRQKGQTDITLSLKPPDLGKLQLSLINTENGVNVKIQTQYQAAKEILISHISELKATLLEQGIRFEKIDIHVNHNFDQSMANTRQESNKPKARSKQQNFIKTAKENFNSSTGNISEMIHTKNNILDLVA